MTYNEFANKVKSLATTLSCQYAYHHFPLGSNPILPWIVFDFPESRSVFADDQNYCGRMEFTIEFYSEIKDFEKEQAIENFLRSNRITYRKYEDWVDDERFYRISYEGEVIINA